MLVLESGLLTMRVAPALMVRLPVLGDPASGRRSLLELAVSNVPLTMVMDLPLTAVEAVPVAALSNATSKARLVVLALQNPPNSGLLVDPTNLIKVVPEMTFVVRATSEFSVPKTCRVNAPTSRLAAFPMVILLTDSS